MRNNFYRVSGGYYIIERKSHKLQIVVLNTNLMKHQEGNDEDARKQWDWLETVLEKFSRNKQTVSSFSNCSFILQKI